MPSHSTSRRAFLGALAGAAGAAPLALAGAKPAPAKAAPPTDPRLIPTDPRHDPAHAERARRHLCDCGYCIDDYNAHWSHPLVIDAMVACNAACTALARLGNEHCGKGDRGLNGGCGTCLDADAFGHVLNVFNARLENMISPLSDDFAARIERARKPDTSLPPYAGAIIALYDLLDSLLGLTHGHCADWGCGPCNLADRTAYFTNLGIDLLRCEGTPRGDDRLPYFLAVERRELLSAERKVARARELAKDGGVFLPHTAQLHAGAKQSVKSHRRMLRDLSRGGWATA